MPELPEVESVRRQLAPRLEGRRILAVVATPQRRFHAVETAAGAAVERLRRRGKYLLADLDDGRELVGHLGMTGSFRFRGGPDGWAPDPYVRATFTLGDADSARRGRRLRAGAGPELTVMDFRDVRRFGTLAVVPAGDYRGLATLRALGPEPLSDEFDPDRFAAALRRSRMPVKASLLTQRPVAGVGNIYADEALWRARINPRARRVGRLRAYALWAAIRQVLSEAIEREGTTFRDYEMVNGESGRNADFLVAYGQVGRPCPRCTASLSKIVLAGRGTTYCRTCQRR
ncbi:MAG: bifunctional DNA-formamidopyrimidine glycosylase/DNA-(apurinic or apyrimidinic site) lyase [Euzebyales bacterium]|nr:bifunctional DNA-formamidopyrimidine glycosylase/DNA-(apurinic or apyrimidinic site) lyase [Euzebyales bacterium]